MSDDTLLDKYAPMLRLADLFTTTGDDLRARARLFGKNEYGGYLGRLLD